MRKSEGVFIAFFVMKDISRKPFHKALHCSTTLSTHVTTLSEFQKAMILTVILLSGKEIVVEADENWTIHELKQRAQEEMGLGLGRLMNDAGQLLQKTLTISQAGLQDGQILTATVRPDGIQLVASWQAFALLRSDGSVVSWGNPAAGGDNQDVQDQLMDVRQIKANSSAFAAILGDGSVVTWGDPGAGGDCSCVRDQLREVIAIQATTAAFAALRNDGHVVTWGHVTGGGNSENVQDELFDVHSIQSNYEAFAAIRRDGSVVTWGNPDHGGDSRNVQHQLIGVQEIQSTSCAFAALLRSNGFVITWGVSHFGGTSKSVVKSLRNVKEIQASIGAFAALLHDGSVVSWGNSSFGGNCKSVQAQLRDVQCIQSSEAAFTAILANGSMVSWGNPICGGDSSSVSLSSPVQQLQSTGNDTVGAFAAVFGRWIGGSLGKPLMLWPSSQSFASAASRHFADSSDESRLCCAPPGWACDLLGRRSLWWRHARTTRAATECEADPGNTGFVCSHLGRWISLKLGQWIQRRRQQLCRFVVTDKSMFSIPRPKGFISSRAVGEALWVFVGTQRAVESYPHTLHLRLREANSVFARCDLNKNGQIERDELEILCKAMHQRTFWDWEMMLKSTFAHWNVRKTDHFLK